MATANTDIVTAAREGYVFEGPCLGLGALIVDDQPYTDAKVRMPLAMLNPHSLVAGVPVFAADIKETCPAWRRLGSPARR
jgi:hypothetical protein